MVTPTLALAPAVSIAFFAAFSAMILSVKPAAATLVWILPMICAVSASISSASNDGVGSIQSGQVLKIVATDPGSVKDFQTFSRQTGHSLLSHSEANGEFTFLLQKK